MSRYLGAGIGWRKALASELRRAQPAVLEIVPDHFFGDPDALAEIAARCPVVFHDVDCSVGTFAAPTPVAERRLERLRELVAIARPQLFSDHLALTRAPNGTEVGHLLPLRYDARTLEVVASGVRRLQDALGMRIVLENIAAPFVIPAPMSEPEFFTRLVERTGCGVLFDLTNLLYNAKNHDFPLEARLLEYPLDAVVQVHLAGGFQAPDGHWVDAHDAPVEPRAFELLELLRGKAPLECIIVERDQELPSADRLLAEANHADARWRGLAQKEHDTCSSPP
jgi:uncharacterized protein (UPF0276 family)